MKRVAIIDIGTNSIKFFVGERQEDGTIKTIVDKNDIAQLGEGLRETGVINPEALERNAQSVAAFAKEAIENCKAFDWSLSDAELKQLDDALETMGIGKFKLLDWMKK